MKPTRLSSHSSVSMLGREADAVRLEASERVRLLRLVDDAEGADHVALEARTTPQSTTPLMCGTTWVSITISLRVTARARRSTRTGFSRW